MSRHALLCFRIACFGGILGAASLVAGCGTDDLPVGLVDSGPAGGSGGSATAGSGGSGGAGGSATAGSGGSGGSGGNTTVEADASNSISRDSGIDRGPRPDAEPTTCAPANPVLSAMCVGAAVTFIWDGSMCRASGCACESNCQGVYSDRSACEAAHASCGPVTGCNSTTVSPPIDPCTPAVIQVDMTRCTRCGDRGFYWNGSACKGSGGCECVKGCERLFDSMASCQAAHTTCPGPRP